MNLKTCVCTLSIDFKQDSKYLDICKNLIDSYLTYTDFDIVVLTDNTNFFSSIKNERLKLYDYNRLFTEPKKSYNFFNMHLKRLPIKLTSQMNYDIIFYHDCDCYIIGWDDNSFKQKCSEDFDVGFISHANPQLGSLRKSYKHFQDKIDNEFNGIYEERFDLAPNPAETRVLFKNNEKLKKFIKFWDLVASKNNDFFTYFDGVYFGTSAIYADMKMVGVTPQDYFTSYCRVSHGNDTLDYFGNRI